MEIMNIVKQSERAKVQQEVFQRLAPLTVHSSLKDEGVGVTIYIVDEYLCVILVVIVSSKCILNFFERSLLLLGLPIVISPTNLV